MDIEQIAEKKIVKFIYENSKGEVAEFVINTRIPFGAVAKRDKRWFEKNLEKISDHLKKHYPKVAEKAVLDVGGRFQPKTYDPDAKRKGPVYVNVAPGISMLKDKPEQLYLSGYVVKKKVLKKGEYKPVKSRELTLAKREIENEFKTNRFRKFKIDSIKEFLDETKEAA
jgi:hypothetical protein